LNNGRRMPNKTMKHKQKNLCFLKVSSCLYTCVHVHAFLGCFDLHVYVVLCVFMFSDGSIFIQSLRAFRRAWAGRAWAGRAWALVSFWN